MKNLSLTFCSILIFSSVAFAADPDPALIRAMDTAKFNAQQIIQVQNIINTARQQGLPVDAISSKVYEGMAKHVAPDKIIQAMERVNTRYEYGYTLARKLAKKEKLALKLGNTVVAGIAAGLTHQDAGKIVNSLQARSGQMNRDELYQLAEETMLTARDLSRQGVSSEATAGVVGKALQKGFNTLEMRTMRSSFNKQEAHGNRESIARSYGTAIDRGMQARDLGAHGIGGSHGSEDGAASGVGNEGDGGGNSGSGDSSGGSDNSGNSDGSGAGNSGDSGGSGGNEGGGSGGSGGSNGGNSGGSGNGGHH